MQAYYIKYAEYLIMQFTCGENKLGVQEELCLGFRIKYLEVSLKCHQNLAQKLEQGSFPSTVLI